MPFSEKQFRKERKELFSKLEKAQALFEYQLTDFSQYKEVSKTSANVISLIEQLINVVTRRKNSLKVIKRNAKTLESLSTEILELQTMLADVKSQYQKFLVEAGTMLNKSASQVVTSSSNLQNINKSDFPPSLPANSSKQPSISSSVSSKTRLLREKEYAMQKLELEKKRLELQAKQVELDYQFSKALSKTGSSRSSRRSKSIVDQVSENDYDDKLLPPKPPKSVQFEVVTSKDTLSKVDKTMISSLPRFNQNARSVAENADDKPTTSYGPANANISDKHEKDNIRDMLFYSKHVKSEPISEHIDPNLTEFSSFLRKYDATDNTSTKHQLKSTPVKQYSNVEKLPPAGASTLHNEPNGVPITNVLPSPTVSNTFTPAVEHSAPIAHTDAVTKVVRACLERPPDSRFSGHPLSYFHFMKRFEDNYLKVWSDDPDHCLTRLIDSCEGRAKQSIQWFSCLDNKHEALKRALSTLQERFGDMNVIEKAHIDAVSKGPAIHDTYDSLFDFLIQLENLKIIIDTQCHQSSFGRSSLLTGAFRRLPNVLQCQLTEKLASLHCHASDVDLLSLMIQSLQFRVKYHSTFLGKILYEESKSRIKRDNKPTPKGNHSANVSNTVLTTDSHNDSDIPNTLENNAFNVNVTRNPDTSPADNVTNENDNDNRRYRRLICFCCDKPGHAIYKCFKFLSMTSKAKFEFISKTQLCCNCLKRNHSVETCRSNYTCKYCPGEKHHSLLCAKGDSVGTPKPSSPSGQPPLSSVSSVSPRTRTDAGNNNGLSNNTALVNIADTEINQSTATRTGPVVQFQLITVRAWNRDENNFVDCTAFLDSGANYSLCSKRFSQSLQLTGPTANVNLKTISNDAVKLSTVKTSFFIKGIAESYIKRMKNVLVVDEIANFSRSNGCYSGQFDLPEDLPYHPVVYDEVDLLIGLQDADLHVFSDLKRLPGAAFYAGKCNLGWVLFGCVADDVTTDNECIENDAQVHQARITNVELHNKLERLFDHDFSDVQMQSDFLSPSARDERALSIMKKSTKKVDGRYVVPMPFISDNVTFPNNYTSALNSLNRLGHRLKKADPSIRQKYNEAIMNLFADGHAVEVDPDNLPVNSEIWYLPHFWVITSGKFRVVFNPSAKFKGISLNSQLINGPDLNNNLLGVLLRFRQYPFAFVGDIKKMYYQVKVPKEQQDFLRFLWWRNGDPHNDVVEYKMTVHVFGGASSGNCAAYALKRTAADNSVEVGQEAVNTLDRGFYVDDGLKSVPTEDLLCTLIGEVIKLCDSGGFCFTKIRTNSSKAASFIPPERLSQTLKDIKDHDSPRSPVLGVSWDGNSDLFVTLPAVKDKPKTMRGILSQMLQIWQPLGHLQPFLLPMKLLIQKLQQLKLDWDTRIPDELVDVLEKWLEHLPALNTVILPRPYSVRIDAEEIQMHCFSDASMKGYAAVAYLRYCFRDSYEVAYLLGKGKVVPLRNHHTMPQLELTAATLSVRMAKTISNELELDISSITYWVDSETVLKYLANDTARYKVFEARRIKFIRANSEIDSWHYVPSDLNSADIGSRGLMPNDVAKINPWIKGPDFLLHSHDKWPMLLKSQRYKDVPIPVESLLAACDVEVSASQLKESDRKVYAFLDKFSSWQKLQRVFARFMRLQKWLKQRYRKSSISAKKISFEKSQTHLLTVHELHFASLKILKLVQDEAFPGLSTLINSKGFEVAMKRIPSIGKTQTQSLRKLHPFVAQDGLLRVGGRIQNGNFPEESKHPVILPAKHHITKLIIEFYHEKARHFGGYRYVIAQTRAKFWILNGTSAVKSYLKSCMICREEKAQALSQVIAPLPADRLTPVRRIFTATALDYFGPITILNKRSREKRWGCLLTCMATRAVHIELVFSLTTDSFLNALFRFIYSRGFSVQTIYSDNASCFKGADAELVAALRKRNNEKMFCTLRNHGITFLYNPPAASHQGGVFERQIRSVRKIFRVRQIQLVQKIFQGLQTINFAALSDEALLTLMKEAESIINSRPITPISDSADDFAALMPLTLMTGALDPQAPVDTFASGDLLRRSWRQTQKLADIFWQQWIQNYIPLLQKSQKWHTKTRDIRPGDLVLHLEKDITPRRIYPKAIVKEVITNSDGHVRRAFIRLPDGKILLRDIRKLALLEASDR